MIVVLDFGSQYTQLIARRVREAHVYCEIHPYTLSAEALLATGARGIILSGGPASVYAESAPLPDPELFDLDLPILGICYGMGVLVQRVGGQVERTRLREFGPAELIVDNPDGLFGGFDPRQAIRVWMSHGDRMEQLPPGWHVLAHSASSPVAACGDPQGRRFGVQFHPEVHHTPRGREILENFVRSVCGCSASWTMESLLERETAAIRARVGEEKVVCGLSGGVDSAVVATLLDRALGAQLTCLFVDTGLLGAGEVERVRECFGHRFANPVRVVDARDRFLTGLAGVEDPERKRRIIGHLFVEVFEEEARSIPGVAFLAQGTLYPDVIESVSCKGPASTIKSHHNVGGLPERMGLALIEPLRELFKDEVRELARLLGLPAVVINRHPSPGPGMAVRILGEVTPERLRIVRAADAVVEAEIRAAGIYDRLWQAFAVLLPVRTVGVMGDERTYEHVVAIRVVESVDGMTADWARLPDVLLERISTRIINEVTGVNRVVYDVSSKPPATIEWE